MRLNKKLTITIKTLNRLLKNKFIKQTKKTWNTAHLKIANRTNNNKPKKNKMN